MSKATSMFRHARQRAQQRFGINFDKQAEYEIVKMIQVNQGRLVERQSGRVTVWDIDYLGKELRVVYDKNRHQVVTFLLRNYVDPWSKLESEKLKPVEGAMETLTPSTGSGDPDFNQPEVART